MRRSTLPARQKTDAFKARYAVRAGSDGTLSQAVRVFDLRRTRSIGHAKTHLQQVLIAVALNVVRLASWLAGVLQAQTRPLPLCCWRLPDLTTSRHQYQYPGRPSSARRAGSGSRLV